MFSDFSHGFYYTALIISTILSFIYFNRVEPSFRLICVLIILTLASELLAKHVSFNLRRSNNIVYHFFTPVEYSLYVLIFKLFLQSKRWNMALWLSVCGLALFEILNSILFQSLQETNTNTMILESVLLVSLSLILFNTIREMAIHENLLLEGIFWFNSAVLFYYSFNILIWGFHSLKVYQLKNPPGIIYDFNLTLSGLLYMTYTFSIVLNYLGKSKIRKTV